MSALIEPIEKPIKTGKGVDKTYILSKLPAITGREVLAKYPVSNMPKLGDYVVSEEIMLKLLSYVAVPMPNGDQLRLTTADLVNNHVPDAETLMRLELAMAEYNFSFFQNGSASTFLESIVKRVLPLITKTLTDSLAQSSRRTGPPSKS